MTSSGELATQTLDECATQYNGQFILVIEGAVPTDANGNYCIIGELNGAPLTMQQAVLKYGPMAKYVVSAGTCASFGGISATGANTTACKSANTILTGKTTNPVVNLPGCPVHPTVLIQTLLDLILTGMPKLDGNNSPTKYFGNTIHSVCERKSASKVSTPGIYGCYKNIGCKGPDTKNDVCPAMKWNNGQAWCIGVNYPCIGCTNPNFPTNPLI